MASVVIAQMGRGGGIEYHEEGRVIGFSWEFAMSPALVLVFGPRSAAWDREYPWAAGRQAEIYDVVGREIVRQKASGYVWESDLEDGVLTVLRPAPRPRKDPPSALDRLLDGLALPGTEFWDEEDFAALARVSEAAREEPKAVVEALTRSDVGWREVEALATLDTPEALQALQAATRHHLSADTRLAAAEALHLKGLLPDLEGFVAEELRKLHRPTEGMARALRLAEAHPAPMVRQALLGASWNQTECAPHCAWLLLRLQGTANDEPGQQDLLARLGLHNSYFERKAAFDRLCELTGMKLES